MENIKNVNRLNDFLFQKYMGEKGDEEQLTSFLNEVLKKTGKDNITDLNIIEATELTPEYEGDKTGILDVLAKIGNTKVNIEVQLKNEHNMDKRTLFYCARLLCQGFEEGQNYMDMPDVIAINILDFDYYDKDAMPNFHNVIHLWDDTFTVKMNALEIHILELFKFLNSVHKNIEIPLHQWIMYLSRRTDPETIKKILQMNPAIMKAEMQLQKALSDEATRRAYFLREKARNDYVSAMTLATRKSKAEGKAEGRQEERRAIIQGMHGHGLSVEDIAKMISLTPQEVSKLII
jgi:predicted transposase/invertase (TIGR01784 family)